MSDPQTFVRYGRHTQELTWELVLKRNSIERLKQERPPLRVVEELPELIARGYEAIPEEDIVRLYWYGIAHDKPKVGTFMVRLKVPGGLLRPDQLRAIGEIAGHYGRDYGELTTRQGIQLHWVAMDKLPNVLDAIARVGLTTVGAEGDTVRNITSCPVNGINPNEWFDVRSVIEEAARFFWGNPDYSNLPRKHKFTISSCPHQCNAPEIHDIALIGVLKDEQPGFAVKVGGGLSATPRLARDLGVFVPIDEAVTVLAAITDVWQQNLRYRLSRAKARIKFLVDDYGPEGVRQMVEAQLGHKLEDFRAPDPVPGDNHLGVHPQKQQGFYYAGFPVPSGRVTGTQLRQIADILEAVGGDIRLTREQNFILGNLPEDRLSWVLDQMRTVGFPIERHQLYGTSTACTSHQFCNYSVAETKEKLDEIIATLEAHYGEEVQNLTIYMDGCPHACAYHWVGDIGLQGTRTTGPNGTKIEAYDVTLRGGLGLHAAIGRPILRRIPSAEISQAIVRLVGAWLQERRRLGNHYTFQAFCEAHPNEELEAIALGEVAASALEATDVAFIRIPGPLLELTDGSDVIEVKAPSVRIALEQAGRRYPKLKTAVLTSDGQLHEAFNLYVNEEDIQSLQGLETPLKPGDDLLILLAMSGG